MNPRLPYLLLMALAFATIIGCLLASNAFPFQHPAPTPTPTVTPLQLPTL